MTDAAASAPNWSWPGADEVHVWRAELDLAGEELDQLRALLSDEERARAERHRAERDRLRSVAARGWLRYLLGRYVGEHPRDLLLVEGAHGKPQLDGAAGQRLRFNASHCEGVAVFAVTFDRDVGIDIERVRGEVPDDVVRRFFPKKDQDVLAALPEDARLRAFYECWTRKEAYLKAIGVGLSGLVQVSAPPAPWSVRDVDAGVGYAASVAVADSARVPAAATLLHLEIGGWLR